jgi:hypothetical protein
VLGFDPLAVDPADCVASAARFTVERFAAGLRAEIGIAAAGRRAHPAPPVPAAAAA